MFVNCAATSSKSLPSATAISSVADRMVLQSENTVDASKEKHVPVLKVEGAVATVDVGSVPHPMEPNHFIAWIEIVQGSKQQRAVLNPGDAPQAVFAVNPGEPIAVRVYCNLHGLWGV